METSMTLVENAITIFYPIGGILAADLDKKVISLQVGHKVQNVRKVLPTFQQESIVIGR